MKITKEMIIGFSIPFLLIASAYLFLVWDMSNTTIIMCNGEIHQYLYFKWQGYCVDGSFCFNGTMKGCSPLSCSRCWYVLEQEIFKRELRQGSMIQLYFAGETEFKNWEEDVTLDVRWCDLPDVGYRIRGVTKQ